MWELALILLFSISIPFSLFAQTEDMDVNQQPRNPILIIPGILGTRISKNYGDNAELWPRIAALVTSPDDPFLEDLSLLKSGSEIIERPMKIGDIVRSISFGGDVHPYLMGRVSITLSHIFDRFIYEMESFGYQEGADLFVFPYDWRLDIEQGADNLQRTLEHIITATGRQKVTIVAHSMGGLLAKEYIAKYGAGLIENIFFIGTPHLGAPKAFKALMYGDDMGIKIPIKGKFTSLLNPNTVKSISQNMPSVYELSPSEKYIESNTYVTNNDQSLTGDMVADLMKSAGRNGALVDRAKEFHTNIDNLDIQTGTYNFVGCDDKQNTLGSIEIRKKKPWLHFIGKSEEYLLHFVKGDETVPVASAFMQGANNLFIKGISHGELPSTEGLGTLIANASNGLAYSFPTFVSDNADICGGIEGVIVSKHSPVDMHIYDEHGNHTGPVESGDIEYGIPNVTYEQLEDTAYAFIPIGEKYQIVNTPTDEGVFDFYAEYVDKEGAVVKKQIWSEVPIHSIDSKFELEVSENGIDSMEEVVNDDTSIVPINSVLTGTSLSDKEPPVTIASTKEGSVVLNASDDVSGVEKTKYSLDGENWNDYIDPISLGQGDKILFLSVDKAGNLEEEKTYIVPSSEKTTPHKKESISGSKPVVSMGNAKEDNVIEKASSIIPIQETKEKTEAKKPNDGSSVKTVARKVVKVKRRVAGVVSEKETEKVNSEPVSTTFFKVIWNKIKSALYYVIWHMKTIIS